MLVKLGASPVQCEIGQGQRGYAVPSIVGENKEDIDGSTYGKGVMKLQHKNEIDERRPIHLPLNFIVMDMEPSCGL